MYNKLLIPLDGSGAAESALSFIKVLQRDSGLPIELVSAVDVSLITAHVITEKARYLDDLISEAERASNEYLRAVAAELKNFEVSCTVALGKPADLIIKRAAAADTLIVMATHGRSGINRWLLGSVAEKVLRGTSSPLFLVRSAEEDRGKREASLKSIIVPLDGSIVAESILPAAIEMAKRLDAEMVLFRAYELPAKAYYGKEDYLPNYDELTKKIGLEVQNYLATKAEAARAEGVTTVTTVVAEGLAADEIIRYAKDRPDSLLTMASHGRSGLQRWVLGSVTETVVRHTRQPILVLRPI